MDIRLDTKFPWATPGQGNLKSRKMIREIGDHGAMCLIRLWAYAAENHQKGVLHGLDETEIEETAGWTGEQGAFASYAIRMRWVDRDEKDGTLSIHDWPKHQPYIFHFDKRSEAASIAAAARWEGKRKRKVNASRKRGASDPHKETSPQGYPQGEPPPDTENPHEEPKTRKKTKGSCAPHTNRNAPSPSPSPKPEKKICGLSTQGGNSGGANASSGVLEAPDNAAPTRWEKRARAPDLEPGRMTPEELMAATKTTGEKLKAT
ncbi:MAG: hypothetical protein A2Z40_04120 [Deltaproteobacteria bacterium RBG_19FT_COMBO_60_16]|nr:MAG: hypothetical protein A2Z40_04120 [Deltaproteobacteria bacterium RBG_19FT_COMBO_60_16]